jgi:ATP-dependent DNA helicase RecQ
VPGRARSSDRALLRLLRDRFGHASFRPGQRRIVRALLDGDDVLGVLPTGAGKSLPYQLAAQVLDGLTVVVSPLIALMRDQVDAMAEAGVGAALVSSTRTDRQNRDAVASALAGRQSLLYLTPERLDDRELVTRLAGAGVALLVIDEAHCISEWGHSFRPAYLELPGAAARLGRPPILALTATASPFVRADIVERLELREPVVVAHGNDRPNLFYEVRRVEHERHDRDVLHELLVERAPSGYGRSLERRLAGAMDGSGLVYAQTTRGAAETARWLGEWGIPAGVYHGQLRKAERERVQAAWMAGDIRVVAATNAFGLGIDKPDVRFVIHRDVPASVEAYMQEAGRAGRDGEPSRCTLVYRPGDLGRAAFLGGSAGIDREDVERVRDALSRRGPLTRRELLAEAGITRPVAGRLVPLLKDAGVVGERRRRLELRRERFDVDEVALDREEQRLAFERSRLEMMRGYAEHGGCRREYLLGYVGEELEGGCRMCDNHALRLDGAIADAADVGFVVGDRVAHGSFGEGTVHRIGPSKVTVLFDGEGYKTLAADLVRDRGVLSAAG